MSQSQLTRQSNKHKLTPPKRWGVFLLNDHYTPMDFVVNILTDVFGLPEKQATAIMLEVHHNGKGLCGAYTRDIAETKQYQVNLLAEDAGYPLMCIIEELSL
ncbi:ATP-dependent Clp protease adapter ClpS [Kingella negevensis]|uniref:ATP-dependent Clp protease adapter protein ClpS n=1 Tax=Kingella negevensis TaxID=1522312 RepID=A0A238TCZ1_9NEIS|nr:ATP-dependent Clp protease adapter ClpS [Kingella negevensis]MDK4696913.1 ATP-dependent Clp protease adapter ClpS [Kingella negevensis]MDK4708092.1 ATP-dependent Clp protease adapter ClpS [Kingella negevensis]MDK4709657.1 ATP-dependent Clp protease adapter ClpS [Kingella negevensis]WII94203.1 ATP-dependent Clp protease adapter ClpS [Kingella negevensis]SNB81186.1 ATP-dependent Clp protease adapter protein ClpS [Kingella negevensis]